MAVFAVTGPGFNWERHRFRTLRYGRSQGEWPDFQALQLGGRLCAT